MVNNARTYWHKAVDLPGAFQMTYVRNLMESRPYLTRIADQFMGRCWETDAMITRDGTRDNSDATYAMAYMQRGCTVTLRTERIAAKKLNVWWFNPRDGKATQAGQIDNAAWTTFTAPTTIAEQDWVLVIDDASKNYPPPGTAS